MFDNIDDQNNVDGKQSYLGDDEDFYSKVLDFFYGYFYSRCKIMFQIVIVIVWMVILGDGIYNFSDGLAVGVVFFNSITGGISIFIVVFCYEFSYEIGQFFLYCFWSNVLFFLQFCKSFQILQIIGICF